MLIMCKHEILISAATKRYRVNHHVRKEVNHWVNHQVGKQVREHVKRNITEQAASITR